MRLGRLPQNTFDRLFGKALPPLKFGKRMTKPGGEGVLGDGQIIVTVSMIINDIDDAILCFNRCCAAVKAANAVPENLIVTINARRRDSESQLKKYLQTINDLCLADNMEMFPSAIQVLGDQRTFTMTALGKSTKKEPYSPKPGDYICMAGHGADSGTVNLLKTYDEQISKRFSKNWIDKAGKFLVTDCDDIFALLFEETVFLQPVSEGGVMAALWDLKERTATGFDIDQLLIPFRQETIEVCDYLGVNPYKLSGDGGMLIVCENPQILKERFEEAGIPFEILGSLTKEKVCTLRKKDENTCLDRPDIDGIWQIYNNK